MDKIYLDILKERGRELVPDDHWIYSEGASATLVNSPPPKAPKPRKPAAQAPKPPRPPPAWNSTAGKVLQALLDAGDEAPCSADDITDLVQLKRGCSITWGASTYIEPELVNLFVCKARGEPVTVFATHHRDGGVVNNIDGPWDSIKAAKASFDEVPEGWTDV